MAFDATLPGQVVEANMPNNQSRNAVIPSSEKMSPIEKLFAGKKGPLPIDSSRIIQDENEELDYGGMHFSKHDDILRKDPFGVREQISRDYPDLSEEELEVLLDAFGG